MMSTQTTAKQEKKEGMIETFMSGAKKGWGIAINTIMPAMVLGYVLVQAFTVTGIMEVLGNLCGPIMGIFGLPGEAVTVLISAFFAKAAGAATPRPLTSTWPGPSPRHRPPSASCPRC